MFQLYIFTCTVHHLHKICRFIRNLSRNMLRYFGLKEKGSDNELGKVRELKKAAP